MRGKPAKKASNQLLEVEKTIENTERSQALVTFSIESTCDARVAFQIVDDLPDDTSPSDVKFHRDYKFEHWTVYENGQVSFTDTIPPDETLDVFYYLHTENGDSGRITSPRIEETTPIAVEADTAAPPTWRNGGADIVAQSTAVDGPLPTTLKEDDSIGTPGDGVGTESGSRTRGEANDPDEESDVFDGLLQTTTEDASETFAKLQEEHDREEFSDFGDAVERAYPDEVDFKELLIGDSETELPSEPSQADPEEAPASTCDDRGEEEVDPPTFEFEQQVATDASSDERSVLARLLQDLEESELAAEEQNLLREQLGLTAPHHMEVKMQHLQSQVADLTAYIDALETFLDDKGSAREVLGTFEEDLEGVQTSLDHLEETVSDVHGHQTALSDRLETVEDATAAVPQLRTDVDQLRGESEDLSGRLDEVEETIGRVSQQKDTRIESLEDAVDRHHEDITALQDTVETLRDQYESVVTVISSAAREFRTSFEADPDTEER